MKPDKNVLKRFDELLIKAQLVERTISTSNRGHRFVGSEKFQEWATSAMNLLQRIFGVESVHYSNFNTQYSKFEGYAGSFEMCKGIFTAAKEDYEGGYLFNLKSLLSAEVIDNVLEQAEELLKSGYKDPACVAAGVALETTLRQLCDKKNIPNGKLDKMNADLYKAGVYNVGMQKQITAWADRRNNAAHGKWDQYSEADVRDMIQGINRFIADNL